MRKRIARAFIRWAYRVTERIHPDEVPRCFSFGLKLERGEWVLTQYMNDGCPLWYLNRDDYEKAIGAWSWKVTV